MNKFIPLYNIYNFYGGLLITCKINSSWFPQNRLVLALVIFLGVVFILINYELHCISSKIKNVSPWKFADLPTLYVLVMLVEVWYFWGLKLVAETRLYFFVENNKLSSKRCITKQSSQNTVVDKLVKREPSFGKIRRLVETKLKNYV